MKYSIFSAFIISGFLSGLTHLVARADDSGGVAIESTIEHVVVYPDSAKVTRTLKTEVPSGQSVLQLSYLPSGMDLSNVKAEILSADATVIVRDITFQNDAKDLQEHPRVLALKAQLDTVRGAIGTIQKQIEMLSQQRKFAEALTDSFTDGYGKKEGGLPSQEEVEATWQYREKIHWEVDAKIEALEAAKKPLEQEKEQVADTLSELLANLKLTTQSVAVTIEAGAACELQLALSYGLKYCSWMPVYEVRAYPSTGKVQLRYQVSVFQNSGESWDHVTLTLSTASANRQTSIPELYPITLNQIEPMNLRMDAMKTMAPAPEATYELSPFAVTAGEMAAAAFRTSYSSYQVTLPQKFSMDSGKERKKSLIAAIEVDGEFWSVISPKTSAIAYLVAELQNDFEIPLLQGESILFVDDEMVGRSILEETAVGENVELSLGVNENIAVERKSGEQNEKDRGFIQGKRTHVSRQYFTTIVNHSGIEQKLVVKDQFPISQNDKIEVKCIAPTMTEIDFDPLTGLFEWDFELGAGKTKTLETQFEVSYPENWDVSRSY